MDKILLLLATFCAMGAGASIVVHMNIFGEVTDVFTQARFAFNFYSFFLLQEDFWKKTRKGAMVSFSLEELSTKQTLFIVV